MPIDPAKPSQWPPVEGLLKHCGLPLDGAREHLGRFVVYERGGDIVGCAGAEVYGDVALLRSVAVQEAARGSGIGDELTMAVLARLRGQNVSTVALLTTTAGAYFARRGFRIVEREALPAALQASQELKGACPATAVAMMLVLR